MTWNSTVPIGTQSVKQNRPVIQQNFSYIETNMGNSAVGTNTNTTRDHFWDVGTNEDGRHRFIQSMGFTVGGTPTDPVVGTGMDGVIYFKEVNGTVQAYFKNTTGGLNDGIFQFVPGYLFGSVNVPSSNTYNNVAAVPDETWGEIVMFLSAAEIGGNNNTARSSMAQGFFHSTGGRVHCWSISNLRQGVSPADSAAALKFANGSDSVDLNIKVRAQEAPTGKNWSYRIMWKSP